jgi:hypothetical protein
MKGLEEYISKHGRHFTEELASYVTEGRWNPSKVERDAQRHVYYNVTGSTPGDMVYLMTFWKEDMPYNRKIKVMLSWVEDYNKTGSPFLIWLTVMIVRKESFDFTPYI